MIDRYPTRSRRQLIRDAAIVAAAASGWLPSRPLRAQTSRLQTVHLSEHMVAVLGPDANVVAADSPEGLVLVDGGHASWSADMLGAVVGQFADRPFRALFNTHWHPEQTGANLALGERGVEIIAHENTKLWLGTEVWVRWSGVKYPPLPDAALPTTTFYDEPGRRQFADRAVDYGYMLHAHTDGDIWVFFPDENVLVAGGPVSNAGWPVIDWWTGGWTGGMLDAFDALHAVADERTRIVPSRGPIMSLADLEAQRRMYTTIFDRIHEMLRQALSAEEVLAARPTAEFDAAWGDPEQFVTLAFQSTWGHLRDAHSKRMRNIA